MNKNKVNELASLVEALETNSNLIKEMKAKHKKELEALDLSKKSLESMISKIKEEIEKEAIKEFKETGNKTLYGGIKVQEAKTLEYDEKKAFEFAKEKGLFLILDKKAFEKTAPTLAEKWIKVGTSEKVTYPKVIKLDE